MNHSATKSPRVRSPRGLFAQFTLLLAVTTAGVSWLVPVFIPSVPVAVQALLGCACGTALSVPILWYGLARRGGLTQREEGPSTEQIVRSATEGILTINKFGQVLSLNPAAEQLFGYRSAEVRNQPVSLLLTDPPSRESQKILHDSLPVGSVLGLAAGAREVIGKHKGGDTFPLELTISSVSRDDDPISVVFARNISKRKQAQRYLTAHYAATCILAEAGSLREALPRILQAICEAMRYEAGAFWRLDPEAGVLRCAELYQAPLAAQPKRQDAEALTCERDKGLPGRAWSAGKPFWVEDLLRTKDCPCLAGPLQLRGAFAFPILREQEVCGAMTFFSSRTLRKDDQLLDIMAELGKQIGQFIVRKQNEEALRETTQTLQALVQAAPVAINIIDLRSKVRLWNPAAERILGWTAAESLGQLLPWLPNGGANGSTRILPAVLQGQTIHGLSVTCRKRDGMSVEVSLSAGPLRDGQGAIFGAALMLMDLTEQKQLEDQLRQAQKMEAVGQLAGGVAHDFNNLLTIINGYSHILGEYFKPGNQGLEYLEQIRQAGERATGLTRQLLAFGRKQVLQVQVLDLNTLVSNLEKMLRRLIGEDIEIVIEQEPLLGQVKADPGQIEQVLLNLAVNARDAMPRGGTLTLTTANVDLDDAWAHSRPETVPGPYVQLAVRDTGCGMNAETKARIFEPFFTTKEVGKGTGLGLATVYGIVKQSDGHIEVESELGHGATFRVYLPRLEKLAPDSLSLEEPASIPRGKETVLLVEDEENVRQFLHYSLRLSGYRVLEAGSGQEALTLCEQHKGEIDLLVTDVIMPHMNGRELAERATTIQPDLRVLYISGYTDNVLDNHGILAPGTAFLYKPVTPKALAEKVREVLDRCDSSRGLRGRGMKPAEDLAWSSGPVRSAPGSYEVKWDHAPGGA
ncbi:MAG: PAS domain S-box protein [Gemmataceae bacterium]|nr:PAS domain S-box protein [Gemmataceae bacterium]